MRTKHLLTAMVLPALFAACTNEELDVVSNVELAEGRAIVENVKFNISEGVESRLTYNNKGYEWQDGDQLGACLMDEITSDYRAKFDAYGQPVWNDWFTLVDYIQTNYKFTRDAEGNWETEAKMCEGNYFLAFPYNKNMGLRAAYTFSCADQTLEGTDDAALGKAFAENNSFVGYAKVLANNNDKESVNVPLAPVFESTGFVLKNTGTDSYTIEKIVLSGNKVSSFARVDPTNTNYTLGGANKNVLVYTYDGRIDVAIEGGNVIAPQESINVIVMSGTAEIDANDDKDAVLEIHTDKGLIRGINLNEKQTANNGQLDDRATVNVLTDKALPALGKADKVAVTFDDTSVDIPNEMDIYSSDELLNLIKWNSTVNNVAVKANLKAGVELTAEMYDILKNSGAYGDGMSTLTIAGDYAVTVKADAGVDAMDLVTFENSHIYVEGVQTITKNIGVPVTVGAKATFNVAASVFANVKNYGTVNVTEAASVTKLENEGTVTADANLDVELVNYGVVTNNATLDAIGENYGTLENNGTLKGALKNIANAGIINNYGKILSVENNNVIVMKDKEARINEANGTGEIDNTIQSDYIAVSVKNIVFVKVADLTATELHEIVLNADATKAYVSGTLTIDPAKAGGDVEVTHVKEVVADGDLTITGKGKVWFSESPSFTVAAKTETVVDNGSTLSISNGILTVEANGLLTIKNNAKVICGSSTGNIENYGNIQESGLVVVSNAQELGTTLAAGNDAKLRGDIDCGGEEWTPIGTANSPYTGTIDGNGYKISNLTISGTDNAALIAYTSEDVTIKNLTLENVNINSTKNAAGVVCNAGKGLKLENITVSGTINATSYAAGLVFEAEDITITNCVNTADISADRASGIGAWIISATIENVSNSGNINGSIGASGIAEAFSGTIKNAKNSGTIKSTGNEPASGIIGIQKDVSTYEYCFNYGNVISTCDDANASAAGILGQTPGTKATLNYCANFGDITAENSYAAGIAYSLYGSITASYCYNNGAVNGTDGAGGIAPKAQYGANDTAKYCLNAGLVTSSNGKTYQGSNKNTSSYYYNNNNLLNVSDNTAVDQQTALQTLNSGTDTGFFTLSNGKISVVR